MKEEWRNLCQRLDYQFNNPEILQQALTHKSYLPAETDEFFENNERIEFLGDAVLDLVISEMLMEEFPELDEGGLSKFRASLVSESGLSKQARGLDLGLCLLLGRGEEMTGGRNKTSLLADTFEAVMAAIYLDSREKDGLKQITRVIQKIFLPHLPQDGEDHITRDYKSELQEHVQKLIGIPSTYKLVEESGPDHEKEFTMAVFVREKECGRGTGASKKLASQLAAENALRQIEKEPDFLPVENIN
ncbi:MAG: ribonuclease III [SAR324 cluster bacterium]|nr:ribonuclease III [SAR324 cluster bacterium]MBL7035083.1 ribonuclease III [SAR324 cluster bacterium]